MSSNIGYLQCTYFSNLLLQVEKRGPFQRAVILIQKISVKIGHITNSLHVLLTLYTFLLLNNDSGQIQISKSQIGCRVRQMSVMPSFIWSHKAVNSVNRFHTTISLSESKVKNITKCFHDYFTISFCVRLPASLPQNCVIYPF